MSRYSWPENIRRDAPACRSRANGCVCNKCISAIDRSPPPPQQLQPPQQLVVLPEPNMTMYTGDPQLSSQVIMIFIFYLVFAYLLFSIGLFVGQFRMMKKYMMGLNKPVQQPI